MNKRNIGYSIHSSQTENPVWKLFPIVNRVDDSQTADFLLLDSKLSILFITLEFYYKYPLYLKGKIEEFIRSADYKNYPNRVLLCLNDNDDVNDFLTDIMILCYGYDIKVMCLKSSILENFGDLGLSKTQFSLQVKYYNPATRIGIVRVSRDNINVLWTSMIFITRLVKTSGSEIPMKFRVLDCKATIKKVEASLKKKSRFWVCNTMKYFDLDAEGKKELESSIEKTLKDLNTIET